VLTCHCTEDAPVAAAEKFAVAPASTARLEGLSVMVGLEATLVFVSEKFTLKAPLDALTV
jgi:hypothetical protein